MEDREFGYPGTPEYTPAGHEFVPPKITVQNGKKKKRSIGFNKDTLVMSLLAASVSLTMFAGSGIGAGEDSGSLTEISEEVGDAGETTGETPGDPAAGIHDVSGGETDVSGG